MESEERDKRGARLRKPEWLRVNLGGGERYGEVSKLLESQGLHTICSSGRCPNQGECWREGTATFMILGDVCTRRCRFCATASGVPLPPSVEEAARVADSARAMRLRHVVVTSVDRDDLADGGAAQWCSVVRALRRECPAATIEALLPDFMGKPFALERVLSERPDIAAHNIETVERLTPSVRSHAKYRYSLDVLARIAGSGAAGGGVADATGAARSGGVRGDVGTVFATYPWALPCGALRATRGVLRIAPRGTAHGISLRGGWPPGPLIVPCIAGVGGLRSFFAR